MEILSSRILIYSYSMDRTDVEMVMSGKQLIR